MEIWKTYTRDLSTEEARQEYIVEYANMWQTAELATIKKCIDNGFDVNKQDSVNKFMSLHWAVCYTCVTKLVKVIEMLLENGAKVNAKDNKGRTPLHLFAECNQGNGEKRGAVDVLLDAGADVNATDDDERTPLHLAMLNNINFWAMIMDLLNNTGIDINIQDNNGYTPLHLLAMKEKHHDSAFIESIKLLVRDNRIDCTIEDKTEKTAFDYVKDSFLAPQEEHCIITEWREKSQAKSE